MKYSKTKQTGNRGEEQAAEWLQSKGFEIVTRNFRYKRAEIDLIVRKDSCLIFVEVKTRSGTEFGEPETFVSSTQRKQIHAAAAEYIYSINWQRDIRFDIVAITLGSSTEIFHIEDAFY